MQQTGDHRVTTLEALEALYDKPYGPAIVKEIDRINPHYRKFIEAAPFFARRRARLRARGGRKDAAYSGPPRQ
jgi:predicted pyridoxine 5'-phosphate oxidase superfamily flavin-nucleotide-binding protein